MSTCPRQEARKEMVPGDTSGETGVMCFGIPLTGIRWDIASGRERAWVLSLIHI